MLVEPGVRRMACPMLWHPPLVADLPKCQVDGVFAHMRAISALIGEQVPAVTDLAVEIAAPSQ